MSETLAARSDHENFAQSLIWQDYTAILQSWIEDVRDHLEVEKDRDDILHYQGVVDACRRFLQLPEIVVAAFDVDKHRNGAGNG